MEQRVDPDKEQVNSFKYAFDGLIHALREGRNFRIQALLGILVLILAWIFNFARFEWVLLFLTISLVLTAELLNTVIELAVDLASQEKILPKAKIAKDVSAASVLLISIFSVIVGLVLFIPHIQEAISALEVF
ncbi:MAG: diacylglycerol kinase family protein [Candidatus Woykebacteria bacterium]